MKLRRREPEQQQSRLQRLGNATGLTRAVTSPESRFRRVIRDTRSELRKVVWPTREQATNLTILVIMASAAVGVLLGGIDFLFTKLFEYVIGAQ